MNTFYRFIDEFGTHYLKHADMGAMYGLQSEFTYTYWEKLEKEGIDVSSFVEIDGLLNIGVNISHDSTAYETFTKYRTEVSKYVYGAPPPSGDDDEFWHNLVIEVSASAYLLFKIVQQGWQGWQGWQYW